MTIPLPFTYTRTLAVPRSTPIRFPNKSHPLNRRPETTELRADALVPAVPMVRVGDFRAAAGRQPGQDKRRSRPHVQCTNAGTDERGRPANDSSGGPGSHYLRPHLTQLPDVQQTVIEHPLVHVAHPPRLRQEHSHGRLQVRGESRVRQRLYRDAPQLAFATPPQPR